MAWVRRVRTASGATAVQIAESVDGRRRIVAHVGSAHTEVELGLLLGRARAMLGSMAHAAGQDALDLGVEPTPRRVRLASAAMDPVLFPETLLGAGSAAGRATRPAVEPRVAAARVVGTSSELLYDVLAHLYSALGFDVVGNEVFRDLVVARVVEPTSILDTGRVLTDLGRTPASVKTMRRTLGRAQQGKYREQVAGACFGHAARHGDLSLCLYDVTTLYFEAENEDPDAAGKTGLRKVGYSKERRVDPQIVVGLLVDRHGFPLEVGCFEGNRAECDTRSHAVSGSRGWRA